MTRVLVAYTSKMGSTQSAVFGARWRPEAARFLRRFHAELSARPVWLFESGWVGPRPDPRVPTAGARRRAVRVGAPVPAVFGGRLGRGPTGVLDRAPAGDARDWDEVRAWADRVAATFADSSTGGRR